MKNNAFMRVFLPCLCTVSILFAGCAKQEENNTTAGDEAETIEVSFSVIVPDAVNVSDTRAVDAGPYLLTGQKGENEVNTITLFIVGVNGGVELRSSDVSYKTISIETAKKYDPVHSCSVSVVGTKTFTQHVYIGANLSDSQIAAFLAGEPIVSSATSAPGVLDEVMDFDADGKACNMVMFTQVKNPVDGSYIFRLTGKDNLNGETNPKEILLERLVGKVLLTFAMDGSQINFTDRFGAAYKGWCTLEDIDYILPTVGRRTFIERHSPADNISSILNEELETSDGRNLYFGTPFIAASNPVHPVAYDESRMKSTSASAADAATHYFEGVYALETQVVNDIDNPTSFGRYVTMDDIARGAVPYLAVRFRYVPSRFFHGSLTEETVFSTRAEAEAVLTDGTFYVNEVVGHKGYYTPAAYEAALSTGQYTKSEFAQLKNGICYYRAFINAPAVDAAGVQTYAGSTGQTIGLERNNYHIVNVPTVVLPGDAELRDYIRVNSTVIDWANRGSNTVNVIP